MFFSVCEKEIIELEKNYWNLKTQASEGIFDKQLFCSIVQPPLSGELAAGFFHAFDENCDGHMDFREMACGISACCRGPCCRRLVKRRIMAAAEF